jgi:hypothetical protein
MFQALILVAMKNFIICFFILGAVSITAFSQEERFTVRSGAGYYMDVFTTDDGPVIWLEGGYKFNTGFNINGRVSMASLDWKIREGTFEDYTTILLRQMVDLTFSRPVNIKGQHFLEPGFGFKLKKEYFLKPDVTNIYSGGTYYQDTSYSDIFWEIGFTICLDYYYQFQNNFYLGMRADTNIIWALGFEGLTFSPLFGFRF